MSSKSQQSVPNSLKEALTSSSVFVPMVDSYRALLRMAMLIGALETDVFAFGNHVLKTLGNNTQNVDFLDSDGRFRELSEEETLQQILHDIVQDFPHRPAATRVLWGVVRGFVAANRSWTTTEDRLHELLPSGTIVQRMAELLETTGLEEPERGKMAGLHEQLAKVPTSTAADRGRFATLLWEFAELAAKTFAGAAPIGQTFPDLVVQAPDQQEMG